MTVNSRFPRLSLDKVNARVEVIDPPIKDLFGACNALKEHVFEVPPTGITTRTHQGHNHATHGGPLTRGCLYSEDGGREPLWTFTPNAANAKDRLDSYQAQYNAAPQFRRFDTTISEYYVSPLLAPGARLRGKLVYQANTKFKLHFYEQRSQETETIELLISSSPVFVDMLVPLYSGNWNALEIFAESLSFASANPSILSVYMRAIYETVNDTTPRIKGESKV